MNLTWSDSLGKVGFLGVYMGFKFTYMSYLGKVFENVTNKVQFFQRFKNFQFFRVFVLRKISNLVQSQAILLSCAF